MKLKLDPERRLCYERHTGAFGGASIKAHRFFTAHRGCRAFNNAIGKVRVGSLKHSESLPDDFGALDDQFFRCGNEFVSPGGYLDEFDAIARLHTEGLADFGRNCDLSFAREGGCRHE